MNMGHGMAGMFMFMPFLGALLFIWFLVFTIIVVSKLGKIEGLLEKLVSGKKITGG